MGGHRTTELELEDKLGLIDFYPNKKEHYGELFALAWNAALSGRKEYRRERFVRQETGFVGKYHVTKTRTPGMRCISVADATEDPSRETLRTYRANKVFGLFLSHYEITDKDLHTEHEYVVAAQNRRAA